MKVLILMQRTVYSSRGGAEVQADFVRDACLRAGHAVHFAFDATDDIRTVDDGAVYHRLPDRGLRGAWKNFGAVEKVLKTVRPDLVYQRVRFSYTGIGAYLCRSLGIPFVHNISADYACKKNNVGLHGEYISGLITELLGRYGIRHANLLIAQTKIQADLLLQNFGLSSVVIPNGHPVPNLPFVKDQDPLIAWVANIKPWKQPEVFIELADRLRDTNAQFVMAGKSSSKEFHSAFIDEVSKRCNLRYLGQLSLASVNELLERASIFVNTSLPREGFPNTFIQAWLRQTPVVALNVDPDNINTENGIGYMSGSVDQLERDLRTLITEPAFARDMGARARNYAAQHFDSEVVGQQYLSAFESLRGGTQSPR